MAAPSVVNSTKFGWAAAYPLACSGSFDSTGCNTVLVVFHCMTGESTDPVCTYGGATGTLVGRAWKSTSSSAGTIWVWAITGFTAGVGTVSVSQAFTYCNSGGVYVVGLSGANGLGASSIVLSDTPTITASIVSTGGNSTFISFVGAGQAPTLTPAISPTGTLLQSYADIVGSPPVERGNIYSSTGSALGATLTAQATATYNYSAAAVIEVLGVSGGPAITSGAPLSIGFGIGAGSIAFPPTITSGALSISTGIQTGNISFPPLVVAGPLSVSLVQKTGNITFPPLIVSGPLSISTAIQTGQILFPIIVTANPLSMALGAGTGQIKFPPTVFADPLSISVGLSPAAVTLPNNMVVAPLSLGLGVSPPSVVVTPVPPQITTGPLPFSFSLGTASFTLPTPLVPKTIAAGAHATLTVRFTPSQVGTRNGTLSIASNDPSAATVSVPLSGSATAALPVALPLVTTLGNQFMASGAPIRLKSINYTGGEGTNFAPHALWQRPWKGQLDQIKGWGFNCLRFQLSGDFCQNPLILATAIDAVKNPDVVGKRSLEFLDMIVDYCRQIGLYIVLDHHRCSAAGGTGTDGWPGAGGATGAYSQAQWIADWLVLANRYKDSTVIVGADVHNEPYQIEWAYWAPMVEACGNAIGAVAPNWLIFVEGDTSFTGTGHYPTQTETSDSIWWGAQLIGAQPGNRPISLTLPNRVVYAPHEYGLSVSAQSWLADQGKTVTNWPNNLLPLWKEHWGWAFEQNIAPIWVGEFGGKFGFDNATGAANGSTQGPYEIQWLNELIKYLNGDFNGDGTSDLTGTQKGMSFAYWNNMLSGDTGSLLIDNDLTTPQAGKITLLQPLLTA